MVTPPDEHAVDKNAAPTSPASTRMPQSKFSFQAPLIPPRIILHHPKAGLNPIADAAAHLFSIMGRLKQLKSYRHLSKLQQELIQEIQNFQNTAKAQGYSSEHILVSRYALCATFDDLIQNTPWGSQGQWESHSLLATFHPDTASPDRFFIILERLIKEPALYIDILELMYICLSLGFEGPYRSTIAHPEPFHYFQFEKIIQGLYQQIRAYRGDFQKNLSPYFIKPPQPPRTPQKSSSLRWSFMLTSCFILIVLSGLGYSLGTMITQINQDLKQIGKSSVYETHL
jgi:type VI secretion system protein ImpK